MSAETRSRTVRADLPSRRGAPAARVAAPAAIPSAPDALSGPGRKKGFVKVMYRMHPRQVAALRAEAFRRSEKLAVGRPDASEVLREIVDAWLDKRGR